MGDNNQVPEAGNRGSGKPFLIAWERSTGIRCGDGLHFFGRFGCIYCGARPAEPEAGEDG